MNTTRHYIIFTFYDLSMFNSVNITRRWQPDAPTADVESTAPAPLVSSRGYCYSMVIPECSRCIPVVHILRRLWYSWKLRQTMKSWGNKGWGVFFFFWPSPNRRTLTLPPTFDMPRPMLKPHSKWIKQLSLHCLPRAHSIPRPSCGSHSRT